MQYGEIISDADEPEFATINDGTILFSTKCLYGFCPVNQEARSRYLAKFLMQYLFKPFPIVPPVAMKRTLKAFKSLKEHRVVLITLDH